MSKKQRKAIAKVDAREASERDASFDEWFVAQYGERPEMSNPSALKEAVDAAEASFKRLRRRLSNLNAYESIRDAALKAWSAARTQKP